MHIQVNPMIIAKKMNHGIFGIIDFGENQYGERNLGGTQRGNYGKNFIRESEAIDYGNSV